MLRMDHYPYSRFWAIWMTRTSWPWSSTRKGPPSFYGGSRRPRRRHRPHPLRQQRPPLPCALVSASARPSAHAAWPRVTRGQAHRDARHGRRAAVRVPCVTLDGAYASGILPRTLSKCFHTGSQKARQCRGRCSESVEHFRYVTPSMGRYLTIPKDTPMC